MDGGSGSIDKLCLTLATPWTVGFQAPLSMGFSRQEYWSGLPFSSPGDLPDPGIKLRSPASQADSLLTESPGKPIRSMDAGVKSLWRPSFDTGWDCQSFTQHPLKRKSPRS